MTAEIHPYGEPLRTSEFAVRAKINEIVRAQNGELEPGFTLVRMGRFLAGGMGRYAAVKVVALRDDAPFPDAPFSIHTCILALGDDDPKLLLESGTYDLTLEQAAEEIAS